MSYLVALFPILAYVIMLKVMDGFSIASWTRIGISFLWGLLCCAFLFLGSSAVNPEIAGLSTFLEEFLKCFPLVLAVCFRKVAFFSEALIYGAAAGAGFAFLENILYVTMVPDFSLGDATLRGFGTAILHIGCTALQSAAAVTLSRIMADKSFLLTAIVCCCATVPSFIIHYTYNLFLIPEFLQLVLTVFLMTGILFIIYCIDEKLIHKWLDSCISNDVSLLASIREGHLRETPAGEYLMEMRRKFAPEVFFDICAYLGLYLEMSIAAKSRMIMKEAGMAIPVNPDTHRENLSKLGELKALGKNIGAAGLMTLSPVINMKAIDKWVIDELL